MKKEEQARIYNFLYSKNLINPKRDWIIICLLIATFAILFVIFDLYAYKNIVNGDMFVSVNKSDLKLETLRIDDLKKVLADFEAKKSMSQSVKIEHSVDPSL